jgi:putative membrane protein
MIRSLTLAAALAVGMSASAFAAEANGPATQNLFTEAQAREHLQHLGYTNVSGLTKDEDGRWTGTAKTKDGETRSVAVDVKGPAGPKASATN